MSFMRSSTVNWSPWLSLAVQHCVYPVVVGPANIIGRIRDLAFGHIALRPEFAIPFLQLVAIVLSRGNFVPSLGLWLLQHTVAAFSLTLSSFPVHRSSYSWTEGCPDAKADFGCHAVASTAGVYGRHWSS